MHQIIQEETNRKKLFFDDKVFFFNSVWKWIFFSSFVFVFKLLLITLDVIFEHLFRLLLQRGFSSTSPKEEETSAFSQWNDAK